MRVFLVLLSATLYALLMGLGNVVRHRGVTQVRQADADNKRAIRRYLRNRDFRIGLGIVVVGFGFHVLALQLGRVVTVQTIGVSAVVWILIFAAIIQKARITRVERTGSALVVVGLVLFVVAVRPTKTDAGVEDVGWAVAIVVVLVVCAALIVIARRLAPGAAATLLGVSAGIAGGTAAALIALVLRLIETDGLASVLGSWIFYVTALFQVLRLMLPIRAFQAGPVTAAMPPFLVFNPATAYVLGVVLLNEPLDLDLRFIVGLPIAVMLILPGIFMLARSPTMATGLAEEEKAIEDLGH